MCDFGISESMIIAGVVMSAAATAASYVAQSQAASAQNKMASDYSMAQSKNLLDATTRGYQQAQDQTQLVDAQASQKLQQEQLATRSATATSMASAAGSGVDGISVQALANDYANREASFNTDVAMNQKAQDDEIKLQMTGMQAQAQSGINQLRSHSLQPMPSAAAALLQIGASGVGAYDKYSKANPTDPNTSGSVSNGPQYFGSEAPF